MRLPLLKNNPTLALVWHDGRCITRAGFTHAARQLAERLPEQTHIINLCAGRLSFMLGLVAAALRGQITLLPPNQTTAALQQLQQQYPQHTVLDDTCLQNLDWFASDNSELSCDAEQIVAMLFTSGSTGIPQAHAKSWNNLWHTAHMDAQRFTPQPVNLVATIPSQHMFGLQTTVLLPLLGGCAIHDSKPFFPADIRAALEAVPAPRALITTPTHLRTCLISKVQLPATEFILSATAPLSLEQAQDAETRWHTQVLEIYGSTEAGAIGTRRTTDGDAWQLHGGTRVEMGENGTRYHADHLAGPLSLNDQIELLSNSQFRLLGRDTDQVKIAGKRGSLNELTYTLLQISGVHDGVIFMPPDSERTTALVVAPQLNPAQILDALAKSVDAVFLPRPLIMVTELPRNAVGKLTQAAMLAALQANGNATS